MESGRSHARPDRKSRPVIFGEVLFDLFPDGNSILGGAPFNVAWHLQGFGAEPLMISRVGSDELGTAVRKSIKDWGMDASGLQQDQQHPTGRVQIELINGQPRFSILSQQAYDFIDGGHAQQQTAAVTPNLIYYGTLAARHPVSAAALDRVRSLAAPKFVDINLREPWWDRDILDRALSGATWLKLNEDEVKVLLNDDSMDRDDIKDSVHAILRRYQLDMIVVTLGDAGAFAVTAEGLVESPPAVVPLLMDTVGAGDAFSAVTILGLIRGWTLTATLSRAVDFAAAVCGMRGATTRDKGLYQGFLERWE